KLPGPSSALAPSADLEVRAVAAPETRTGSDVAAPQALSRRGGLGHYPLQALGYERVVSRVDPNGVSQHRPHVDLHELRCAPGVLGHGGAGDVLAPAVTL